MSAVIIASFVFVVCLLMITDVSTNYGLDLDTSKFNDTFNIVNDTYQIALDQEDDVFDSDLEGGQETSDSMLKGTFTAFRLITGMYALVGAVMNEVAEVFGIPAIVVQVGLALLVLGVLSAAFFFVRGIRN